MSSTSMTKDELIPQWKIVVDGVLANVKKRWTKKDFEDCLTVPYDWNTEDEESALAGYEYFDWEF